MGLDPVSSFKEHESCCSRQTQIRSTRAPDSGFYLPPVNGRQANAFIVGFTDHPRRHLRRLDPKGQYSFHTLLAFDQLQQTEVVPVARLLQEADERLDSSVCLRRRSARQAGASGFPGRGRNGTKEPQRDVSSGQTPPTDSSGM